MGKEGAREIFRQQLAAANKANEYVPNEPDRLRGKYSSDVEKLLEEAEQRFLEKEPIASVIGIVEEASKAIGEREKARGIVSMVVQFEVDTLGFHGPKCYPTNEVEFVKAIEDGKSIDSLINGFRVFVEMEDTARHYHTTLPGHISLLGFFVAMSKDKTSSDFSEIRWNIGVDDGTVNLQVSDIGSFAKLVAEGVANEHYNLHKPADDHMGEGWSMN